MAETAEELCQQPDVREELERTTGKKAGEKVKVEAKDKFWFVTHVLLLSGAAVFYYLLGSKFIPVADPYADLGRRAIRGFAMMVVALAVAKAVSVYAIGRIADTSTRFTLKRILHLIITLAIAVIAISMVFVNWYAGLTALGVGSIILGLAVQTPMTSFIGWIYLLVRRPYRVGDRIKIGEATGDVIDVSYLDTTLWEFGGGDLVSTDHPSGRIIKFPNSKALGSTVYNYTWPLFPYVWNEVKFSISYASDLDFVAETMQ